MPMPARHLVACSVENARACSVANPAHFACGQSVLRAGARTGRYLGAGIARAASGPDGAARAIAVPRAGRRLPRDDKRGRAAVRTKLQGQLNTKPGNTVGRLHWFSTADRRLGGQRCLALSWINRRGDDSRSLTGALGVRTCDFCTRHAVSLIVPQIAGNGDPFQCSPPRRLWTDSVTCITWSSSSRWTPKHCCFANSG